MGPRGEKEHCAGYGYLVDALDIASAPWTTASKLKMERAGATRIFKICPGPFFLSLRFSRCCFYVATSVFCVGSAAVLAQACRKAGNGIATSISEKLSTPPESLAMLPFISTIVFFASSAVEASSKGAGWTICGNCRRVAKLSRQAVA